MIDKLTLEDTAFLMATLAGAAYEDDNRKLFADLGFDQYQIMDVDGAYGHLAASKTEVIITCRGTVLTHLNDLLADVDTIPKRHGTGWVHEGFRREARKLLPLVIDWVQNNRGKDVYITGHSLGAAMATYITQELEYRRYFWLHLYTFGSPRIGNYPYVLQIKSPHKRFVNCNDMVTHVPPEALLFRHHGDLCYINFYGNVRRLGKWQRFKDMMRAHFRAWSKFELFDGLTDHSIDNYISKLRKIRDSGQTID